MKIKEFNDRLESPDTKEAFFVGKSIDKQYQEAMQKIKQREDLWVALEKIGSLLALPGIAVSAWYIAALTNELFGTNNPFSAEADNAYRDWAWKRFREGKLFPSLEATTATALSVLGGLTMKISSIIKTEGLTKERQVAWKAFLNRLDSSEQK